jgi:hypothetical protein
MKTIAMLLAITVSTLGGCAKHDRKTLGENVQAKDSAAQIAAEAGQYLGSLHKQGKLPDVSKEEHGRLTAGVSDFSETLRYPLSLTFRFTKENASIYQYKVERPNADSDWRLAKAWQADATGGMIREIPLQ